MSEIAQMKRTRGPVPGTGKPIGVFAVGAVPDIALKVIAANISGCLNLQSLVLPPIEHPSYALDRRRLQYNVATILKQLEPMRFAGVSKVIGVLSVDLFVPLFTHVFGEARQGGNVALVSFFRLKNSDCEPENIDPEALERIAKVAIHELCHLYNLHHCDDRKCLMYFSGSIKDLDETPMFFCRYCRQYFKDAVSRQFLEE